MRKILTLCIVLFSIGAYSQTSISDYSQTSNDTIYSQKVFGGYRFWKKEKELKYSELLTIVKNNREAYKLIKSAQASNGFSVVLGGVGGFLVGYQLGTAIAGGEPNLAVGGVGIGLMGLSIPISINASKKARQGVAIYNKQIQELSYSPPKIYFGCTESGIGLILKF